MKSIVFIRKHPALGIARICKEKQKAKISITEQGAMSTDFVPAYGETAGTMSLFLNTYASNFPLFDNKSWFDE